MKTLITELIELSCMSISTGDTIERVIRDPSSAPAALDLIELLGRTSGYLERLGTKSLGHAPRGMAAADSVRSYAVTIPFVLRQRLSPRQELATPP